MKNTPTFRLFARPSFLTGVARMLDPVGALNQFNTSPSDEAADRRALRSDWDAVGDDIRMAMEEIDRELSQP